VTCAARDMMPKTETANTTFGFTISGSRRQTFPRLDLVDMEDHLLVMDKDNGRITFYDVDTEAIHREMREWAERVGRRGGGDDGELKIVRGREQKGKGQGRGKGQGKGKGQGRGKGEGKGQGSGKGEGKGRGSGKGEGTRKGAHSLITNSQKNSYSHQSYISTGLSPNDIDLNLPIPTSIIEQEQNLVQETNSSSQRKKQTGKDPSVFRSKWNALQRRIESLPTDLETYNLYRQNVSRHTRILKQVLLSAEAKKRERDWIRYREDGELDDSRLVEVTYLLSVSPSISRLTHLPTQGLTGEKNIYRRRGRNESNSNSEQQKPKRLRFVFDLSMSMGRYDSTDGRLRRSLETAVMIMEVRYS
jgi:von Willebrand factor A domain-containing protein 8